MDVMYQKKEDFLAAIQEYREWYGENGIAPEIYFDDRGEPSSRRYMGLAFICMKDKHPLIYRWMGSSDQEQREVISECESKGYKITNAIVKE